MIDGNAVRPMVACTPPFCVEAIFGIDVEQTTKERKQEQALSFALSIGCELIMGCQMLGDPDENQFFLNTPEKIWNSLR